MTRHSTRGAAALILLLALGACGKVGVLDQPGPLFGAQAREDAAARRAAVQARGETNGPATPAADRPDPEVDNAPKTTREVQAPQQDNLPISKETIPGTHDLTGPTPPMTPN